jgi:hypothetical protein
VTEYKWVFETDGHKHVVTARISPSKHVSVHLDGSLVYDRVPGWFQPLWNQKMPTGYEIIINHNLFTGTLYLNVQKGLFSSQRIAPIADQLAATETKVPAAWDARQIELVEMQRVEQPLGEERRIIDNLASSAAIQRRITVSREWSQTVAFDEETDSSVRAQVGAKIKLIADIKVEAERRIREKYSTSTETRKQFSEEVVISVPAKTRIDLIFVWKQVWQCGIVRIHCQDGSTIDVPYRLCLEPTFDQRQVERST